MVCAYPDRPMPELREDLVTGRTAIVAPGRSARPHSARRGEDPEHPHPPRYKETCPFCAGNECETPPEVARVGPGDPETRGWHVRAVPNLYPVVGGAVRGAHEVVVLSPAHDAALEDLEPAHARAVWSLLRERCAFHLDAGRVHVTPFVNHGKEAGASLAHPHAQLIGVDFVPLQVARQVERFATAGRDLVADAIMGARGGPNVVSEGEVLVWCPPASTSAYMVRCAHPEAGPRFDTAAADHIGAISDAVQDVLRRLRATLGWFAYNVVVHTAPRSAPGGFHWWVDVIPRRSVIAGFELATELYVCTTEPSDAAADLRDAS